MWTMPDRTARPASSSVESVVFDDQDARSRGQGLARIGLSASWTASTPVRVASVARAAGPSGRKDQEQTPRTGADSEDDIASEPDAALAAAAQERGLGLIVLSAQVEMDIAQMQPADQLEFLESLSLEEPGSHRYIRAAYALLDLISMLTAGPDECRAWPIRRNSAAPKAAGKIHSDIERGFIRAEVIWWEDLIELGSEAKCRDAGKLRVEGKDYLVADGDVVHFRFNV